MKIAETIRLLKAGQPMDELTIALPDIMEAGQQSLRITTVPSKSDIYNTMNVFLYNLQSFPIIPSVLDILEAGQQDFVELMKVLEDNTTISSLTIKVGMLTKAGSNALANMVSKNPTLETLEIEETRFTNKNSLLKFFESLQYNTVIKHFTIDKCSFRIEGEKHQSHYEIRAANSAAHVEIKDAFIKMLKMNSGLEAIQFYTTLPPYNDILCGEQSKKDATLKEIEEAISTNHNIIKILACSDFSLWYPPEIKAIVEQNQEINQKIQTLTQHIKDTAANNFTKLSRGELKDYQKYKDNPCFTNWARNILKDDSKTICTKLDHHIEHGVKLDLDTILLNSPSHPNTSLHPEYNTIMELLSPYLGPNSLSAINYEDEDHDKKEGHGPEHQLIECVEMECVGNNNQESE